MNENSSRGMTRAPPMASDGRPSVAAILPTRRPWRLGEYSSVVGLPITAQPDPTQNTVNICSFRGERAEAEANAALVMRALEAFDSPTKLVERITRGMYESLQADFDVLLAALQQIKRDNLHYNFGSKLVRIVDAALAEVAAPVGSAPPSDEGGSNAPSSPPLSAGDILSKVEERKG
jgi:hypothetical protein